MLIAVVLAIGVLFGAPLVELCLVAVGMWEPLAGAALIVGLHVSRSREPATDDQETAFLTAVAGELRSGASLRYAVIDAAARVPGLNLGDAMRLAACGADMAAVADAIEGRMAGGSPLVAPALRLAARDGGSSADTFERLAVRSQQRTELDREVMVATAQSRHSVRLMVVLPVAVFAVLLATGHLARLAAAGPAGTAALAVGVALQSLGLLAMAAMTQRAAS